LKLIIGIDTGGTYTDAVLLDSTNGFVQRQAKSVTTPHDLSLGIAHSIEGLGKIDFNQVSMVSISTTLATNAIVEGHGGRVALLLIGYDEELMQQSGLSERLPVEGMCYITGGHDVKGDEKAPLDTETACQAIQQYRGKVDAFAVSGYFSVMNPDHELRIRKMIQEHTSAPVVCGHELTNRLNAMKRVSTAVLNARLIPLIRHLMDSVKKVLEEKGCRAPLMVVKGDGTLISEMEARQHPVDTILSGPAASAIGAEFLANQSNAIVVDMGGTTTDIAILEDGKPWNNPAGAMVGGWQTCVQAADLRTIGIGGDSHIRVKQNGTFSIGPRRAIPLCRLGSEWPEITQELQAAVHGSGDRTETRLTDFLTIVDRDGDSSPNQEDRKILEALRQGPMSVTSIRQNLGECFSTIERLEMSGIVRWAGLTPTDVLWSDSNQVGGNEYTASAGTRALAGQLNLPVASFTKQVQDRVTSMIIKEILDKLVSDKTGNHLDPTPPAWGKILECLLGYGTIPSLGGYLQVHNPIVAIGAPVANFIPAVAEKMHTACIIPLHAEVGNAVGAAVASITHTVEILVQPHIQGSGTLTYLVHTPHGREVFNTLEEAVERAEIIATELATQAACEAGAEAISVLMDKQILSMGSLSEVKVRVCASDERYRKRLVKE
jgi:N-methylhydantoinase A/oxoprolinase/acetone carboxylase beta subunit